MAGFWVGPHWDPTGVQLIFFRWSLDWKYSGVKVDSSQVWPHTDSDGLPSPSNDLPQARLANPESAALGPELASDPSTALVVACIPQYTQPAPPSPELDPGPTVEDMADAMVEADLAKIRLGYAVIETLDMVERLATLQQFKLRLLSSQTCEELASIQQHIELEKAVHKAQLRKKVPFRDPLGYKIEDIVAIGEKYASSPTFLEPIVREIWLTLDGTLSLAIL
ncbi:hypothetical protein FA13DRAFT_1715791 [Coprinellus micaceus]|uniref:Uncharacterized protein n=1 Tax=Coprinellus micaceus TaxID=71717 RepID=A0A4Y7SLW1_COPMI|nr:hypothetical protein FA13DRAFT_1715791 [Coprinellus micaceus]